MSSAHTYFPANPAPHNGLHYFIQRPQQQQSEHHVQFESYPPYVPTESEQRRQPPNELMLFAPVGIGIVCLAFLAMLIIVIIYGLGNRGYG